MSTTDRAAAALRRTVDGVRVKISDLTSRHNGREDHGDDGDEPGSAIDVPAEVVGAGVLSPRQALLQNGFYVARNAFPESECRWMARTLKLEAGIQYGKKSKNLDAVNRFTSIKTVLFDPRVLQNVQRAIGTQPRFLQVSDLHYFHDTAKWHRDSTARAGDSSDSFDWQEDPDPYRVVKAIVYLESDESGMGMMIGSHRSPLEMDKPGVAKLERRHQHLIIPPGENPNRAYSDADRARPAVWMAQPGDVLVFDERLYHCGRRVREGRVSQQTDARKFTVSFVFGADDDHSARMYSYFRFARTELKYGDLGPKVRERLAHRNLVHRAGWTNFFAEHPEQLDSIHLRDPSIRDKLKERFAAQAEANRGD